ncbi:MAG: hypothetical protein R2834_01220 [Rhodothermales bacterium]
MKPSRSIVAVAAGLVLTLLSAGCDTQAAQEEFIDEANAPASGITIILDDSFGGATCREDADDWRIAPVYNGVVFVDRPPAPNPVSGSLVTITIRVLQFDRVRGGLVLRSFGAANTLLVLDTILDATAPGEYIFQFSPSLLSANGIHRLFIFDSLGEIVSYGDLFVTSQPAPTCAVAITQVGG